MSNMAETGQLSIVQTSVDIFDKRQTLGLRKSDSLFKMLLFPISVFVTVNCLNSVFLVAIY